MMRRKPLSDAVRLALGISAGSLAMGVAPSAFAQDGDEIEEIVTTGTRIPVDKNLLATSPVTTVDSSELTFNGITRVEDLLNDLPQLVPEYTSNDSNGSTGTATLDLRGLGSVRTLTLINGHRMGFGDPYVVSPDINQIPGNLVERVEILTGGASSTYGSDAVSGVVNFIMKDNFEGFQIDYQISGFQHSNDEQDAQDAIDAAGYTQAPDTVTDGQMTNITVIAGVNAANGRGNVTGYIGYREIDAIKHSERDYSACALTGDAGTVGSCGGSSTTALGSFRDFAAIDLRLDEPTGDFLPRAGETYNYGPINYFQRPDERWTGGVFGNYEISENVEGYVEFMFMDDRSLAQIAPSGTFFNNTFLNCDNPLMSAQQIAAIGCTGPNPGEDVVIYVGRRNVEGGPRFDDIQHTQSRSLLGFRGDIGDNWTYDLFGNFARTKLTEVYNNDLSISNIVRALRIVDDPANPGTAVCSAVVDGSDPNCVAYNIFQPGMVTQDMIDYLTIPLYSVANMAMYQGVGYVTGDLTDNGVKLPWADEGLQLVFGVEYRQDKLEFDLDNNYNQGNAAGQGGATADVEGAVNVKEFFTEVRLPLVQGKTGFEDLSLDLRYRYSDYNLGITADTWNVGLAWSPTQSIKLRGSVSQAVRAPNINELFQPQTIGLWAGTDPCAGPTPTLTEPQCALTGVPAGSYGFVAPSPADQYNGKFGGNPDLGAETSDSTTVGILWTPEFGSGGLSVSVDYWSIVVEDAIDTVGPEYAINQCGLTGDAALCGIIHRNQTNGNVWVGSGPNAPHVEATNINIGKFDVEGVDVNGVYNIDFGANQALDFTYRATFLTNWEETPAPGVPIVDCLGTWGGACGRPRPEYKHTFTTQWATPLDGFDVRGTWRYIGSVDEQGNDRWTTGSATYLDLGVGYYTEGLGGAWQLNAGINNILDEPPKYHGLANTAAYSNANTIPGTWDALGRYWFVGLSYRIGSN